MPEIKLKRGLKASIPTLDEAEPGFTTDTQEFFIGSANGNVKFAKQTDLDTTNTNVATNTANIASNTATLNAIGSINANAELVAARGTYPTLAPRLDNVDSSLANIKYKQILVVGTGDPTIDTPKLKSAITSLTNYSALYIKGKVAINDDIAITGLQHITIIGDGPQVSYIYNVSTGKTFTFTNCLYINFDKVGFIGNGDPVQYGLGATGGNGLTFSNTSHVYYSNVEISYNGGHGIRLVDHCYVHNFIHCRIVGNQQKGFEGLSVTDLQATAISFVNCLIYKNVLQGIHWCSVNLVLQNTDVEYNKIGLHIDTSTSITSATAITVGGCDFEANTYEQIKITNTATYSLVGMEIDGNNFVNTYAGADKVDSLIIVDPVGTNIQSFRLGKNSYSGLSNYNIVNLNSKTLASCEVHIDAGYPTKFINLGRSKCLGIANNRPINGLLEQNGIPFTTPDISNELHGVSNPVGYWRLPLNEFGYISSLDIQIQTDATTSYAVNFALYIQKADGTYTASYATTVTQAAGGNAILTFSGVGLTLAPNSNSIILLKTSITMPTSGTTFKVKQVDVNGSY